MYVAFWLIAGLLAGAGYVGFAGKGHPGRERKAYANGLLIAAVIYVALAALAGDVVWLGVEALGVLAFGAFVWLGRRQSFLWVAAGWLLHPLWDVALHMLGPGAHVVPDWYAIACVSFDVLLAAVIVQRVRGWRRQETPAATGLSESASPAS